MPGLLNLYVFFFFLYFGYFWGKKDLRKDEGPAVTVSYASFQFVSCCWLVSHPLALVLALLTPVPPWPPSWPRCWPKTCVWLYINGGGTVDRRLSAFLAESWAPRAACFRSATEIKIFQFRSPKANTSVLCLLRWGVVGGAVPVISHARLLSLVGNGD